MTTLEFPWTLERDHDTYVEIIAVTVTAEYQEKIHTPWYHQYEELTVCAVDQDGTDVALTDEELRDLDLEVRDRVAQEAADVAIESMLLAEGD